MANFAIPGQTITANQWLFSPALNLPQGAPAGCWAQVTDPNTQWFTVSGAVKTWGIQLAGYVGADWDNVAPWAGWGWWLYEPGGDPRQSLILSQTWVPFGRRAKNNGVGLILGLSTPIPASSQIRLAVQTDTAITLGLQVTTV